MSRLQSFIRAVPKVELHLHLVGSASVSSVAGLASRHPDSGVPADPDELRSWYQFTDFHHFIDVYASVASLVRSSEDIADLIDGAARGLAAQNVLYAEMTITPYTHLLTGLSHDDIVAGLDAGAARAQQQGVEFAWVYDIPGEMGLDAARITADLAIDSPPDRLVGFGLGGIEVGVDRADFAAMFDRARAAGLRSVPHAGEADGPASIRAALDHLGADRIGHGVRAVEDAALLERIVAEQVPLEVCSSSNVCTRVYRTFADHSLPILLAAGAFVTINTDDPPMFSTTLTDEYLRVADTFDLDLTAVAGLVRNGINASFLDDQRKSEILGAVDRVEADSR